ncbi:hypothetical protein P5G51_009305 [Virgibacillus sp. 179-BFC.A HS]|uniref:Uncharacterized protein n=1 Tax=Tigheibacillus jepli TaxID=3035914 RepID=A0ABU5CGW3_9BACI|nr:hypothetical protein [Virgibacillus sp. 179-BFC.A HS]MDY0405564.1 hypothetical protein [Virgibacillus sp. 179-BFC.A HS]
MVYAGVTIIAIAIVLLIASFFMKDKLEDLESEIEHLSITTSQDTYQLKKKVKALEEELLSENIADDNYFSKSHNKF